MPKIIAIHGSPRRKGNTSTLLQEAVRGAQSQGAEVTEFRLRDLKLSPCLELYGCKTDGLCLIKDDFHALQESIFKADGLILASPIFFYAVSAHTKIFMDRCQSLWVKKYWIKQTPFGAKPVRRKGVFISVGATQGKKLFDGALMSVKYVFDVFDMELWHSLLVRGIDFEGDILQHPDHLQAAFETGKALAQNLTDGAAPDQKPKA
jgi:multimeric flavodoxin WrbA